MTHEALIDELKRIPQDELVNDLAEILVGAKTALEATGMKDGFNTGKISGLMMKMQFNPNGFSADLGLDKLKPMFDKYEHLLS